MYRCFYVQIYYIAIYVFNIYIYLYKIRSYSHSGAASSTLALIAHSWHISVPASHDGTIWRRRWATRISGLWSCEGFGREDFTAGGGDEYDDNPATLGRPPLLRLRTLSTYTCVPSSHFTPFFLPLFGRDDSYPTTHIPHSPAACFPTQPPSHLPSLLLLFVGWDQLERRLYV